MVKTILFGICSGVMMYVISESFVWAFVAFVVELIIYPKLFPTTKGKPNILFMGVRGAGKGYQASQKVKEGYKKISFADGVREVSYMLLDLKAPLTDVEYERAKKGWKIVLLDEKGKIVSKVGFRDFLILVGDGLRKKFGMDIWVKFFKKLKDHYNSMEIPVVADDCRYTNEALFDNDFERIFCNYKSDRYEIADGDSEWLARRLIELGYKDGDVIKKSVIKKLHKEFEERLANGSR